MTTNTTVSAAALKLGLEIDDMLQRVRDEHEADKCARLAIRAHQAAMSARHDSEERVRRMLQSTSVPTGCSFTRRGFQFRVQNNGHFLFQQAPEPLEHVLREVFGAPDLGTEG